MSRVYFSSDWHLGHRNLHQFGQRPIESVKDNYEFIGDNYSLTKRDTLYLLGDIVFEPEALTFIQSLPAEKKYLIIGNHDWERFNINMFDLAKTFDSVHGLKSYGSNNAKTKSWLSHAPIHESEMRGKYFNVHGHIHNDDFNPEIRDHASYINVNVDSLWPRYKKAVINWQELMELHKSEHSNSWEDERNERVEILKAARE